ncbi:MAG: histidine decarboxylase [Acidobacteriota bacterium]
MPKVPGPLLRSSSLDDLLSFLAQDFSASFRHRIGFPDNLACDFGDLERFWRHTLVNVGDPFTSTLYQVKTFSVERKCIEWFAELYNVEDCWGYVTSCGSEANLHGALIGREEYPEGRYYFSAASHPCMPKIAKMLRLPYTEVAASPTGEMDYEDLARKLAPYGATPAVINLNIGTTSLGAIDRVERVVEVLQRNCVPYYLHCDAALGGMLLPFIPSAPKLDCTHLPIGSISISGHKFIGSPVPCSIFLVDRSQVRKNLAFYKSDIGYPGSADTTIGGSRSGLAPLVIWYALCQRGDRFTDEVAACLSNARYLAERLEEKGYSPILNDFSTTVALETPSPEVCEKWQLMVEGQRSRVVVMQHVDRPLIDEFLADLPNRSPGR